MIPIDSCMIIHYIVKENIFVVIVYTLSLQKKNFKRHIKDCFKSNDKQTIKIPKKGEYVKFKNFERKIKSQFISYADFESTLVSEDNGKQNQIILILPNIKNMLLVVMVINWYVLTRNLVSFLNYL